MLKIASFAVAFGLITGQALAATLVVNSTADDGTAGTLRYELGIAQPGDTITFSLPANSTIQLTNQTVRVPTLNITKSLSIVGPGSSQLTIKAYSPALNSAYDVFDVYEPATPATINVSISGLTIQNANEAVWGGGGAPGAPLTISLQGVNLLNNYYAGAEFDYGTAGTIAQSTISGNNYGVEVYSDATDPTSAATISQSTIAHNAVGIYNTYSNVTVTNSTLFANGSASMNGVSAELTEDLNANATLAFSTIDGASSTGTPGLLALDPSATFTLKSTILAGHPAGNCVLDSTPVSSAGFNLDSDGSCALNGSADQSGTASAPLAAGLAGALASNGGPTQTDALAAAGPAIDWIPTSNCTDAQGQPVTVDQRNSTRPAGQGCDIGAYEYQNTSTPISVSLQLSGYPPSAANFSLVASFATGASINPASQVVGLQIGAYNLSIPAGSFKQLQGGSKTGSWVYSSVINGVTLNIQIVNNGNGTYQFKANGGTVNVGSQTPVAVEITIGSFVGTGSNATAVKPLLHQN